MRRVENDIILVKDTILVVDDVETNRGILAGFLSDRYDILEASDGIEALEIVMKKGEAISLILMDIMMPRMDGFEAVSVLKECGYTERIPVIFLTSAVSSENELKGLNLGAVDFIEKPFRPGIIKSRIATHLDLNKHRRHLEKLVEENVQKSVRMKEAMIDAIASVIEYRDVESGKHVERTKHFAYKLMTLIKRSGLMDKEMDGINIDLATKAMPLHDIGKIGIPDHILLKPGKLTPAEFDIMKKHTNLGANIIKAIEVIDEPDYIKYCREIALYHHERWDGFGGYPNGLSKEQIPFTARVMSIVDVYDALASKRVYKPAFSKEMCLSIINKAVGKQFDPIIARIFIENYESFAYMWS